MSNEGISGSQCRTVGPYGQCVHPEGHEGPCDTFLWTKSPGQLPDMPQLKAAKAVGNALRDAAFDSNYELFLFDALEDLMRVIGHREGVSAAQRLKEGDRGYDDGYEDGRREGYEDGQRDGYEEGYDARCAEESE